MAGKIGTKYSQYMVFSRHNDKFNTNCNCVVLFGCWWDYTQGCMHGMSGRELCTKGDHLQGKGGWICPWDFMVCSLFFIEPGCCLVSVVLVYVAVCLDMHVHQTILIYFVVFSGWGEALPS